LLIVLQGYRKAACPLEQVYTSGVMVSSAARLAVAITLIGTGLPLVDVARDTVFAGRMVGPPCVVALADLGAGWLRMLNTSRCRDSPSPLCLGTFSAGLTILGAQRRQAYRRQTRWLQQHPEE
jgi:hypothetical protein